MNKLAIGADIGGTHITCQVFDLDNSRKVNEVQIRIPVNSAGSKDEIIGSWVEALKQAAQPFGFQHISGIGFGMPGPFDYANGIAWFEGVAKFENLFGVNVKNELQQQLKIPAQFQIRFLNDASCFAIGEAWLGEASHHGRVLAITLGTGFGTTFTISKLPVAGIFGIPDDGFLYRVPFKNSVADEYFSTRWFLKEYEKRTGKTVTDVKELAELTETDKNAENLFVTFGANLGNFLSEWADRVGLQAIVLGGSISKSFHLFERSMMQKLHVKGSECKIYLARNAEMHSLFGCAKLCDGEFYSRLTDSKNH